MTKRPYLALWLAAICALPSYWCSSQQATPAANGAPRVAFVMKALNHPFFLDVQAGAEEAAQGLGLQVVTQAAEREIDVEKQLQIIENLLQTGIKALCVTPSGSREIASAIAKANQAGVPVIVVDTRVDTAAAASLKIASFVGSEPRGAASGLGPGHCGKAHVAILEGIPGHEADSRLRGFRDALGAAPGMSMSASQPANSERDLGRVLQDVCRRTRTSTQCSPPTTSWRSVVEAIAAAGRTGTIKVVGFDAIDDRTRHGRAAWPAPSRSRQRTWAADRDRDGRQGAQGKRFPPNRSCRSSW